MLPLEARLELLHSVLPYALRIVRIRTIEAAMRPKSIENRSERVRSHRGRPRGRRIRPGTAVTDRGYNRVRSGRKGDRQSAGVGYIWRDETVILRALVIRFVTRARTDRLRITDRCERFRISRKRRSTRAPPSRA